jgi:hypothetical protein
MANQTLAKLETLCRKGGMIGEGRMPEPLGFEAMEPEVKVSEVGRLSSPQDPTAVYECTSKARTVAV